MLPPRLLHFAAKVTYCCVHMCFRLLLGSFRLQAGDTELPFRPTQGLDAQLQFGSDMVAPRMARVSLTSDWSRCRTMT